MKANIAADDAKALDKKRKQSVETVFGIIKSAMGLRHFHLRGITNAATQWTLIALASNRRRLTACNRLEPTAGPNSRAACRNGLRSRRSGPALTSIGMR
jgi:hypothetical protein